MSIIPAGPLRPRTAWAFLAAGLLVVAVAALASPLVALVAFVAVAVGSTTAIVVGYRRQADEVRPWQLIAAACVIFLVGALLRSLLGAGPGAPPSATTLFPDTVSLCGYLLLTAGFLGMLRRRRSLADASARLDAALIGLAAGLSAWTFLIGPTLEWSGAVTTVAHVLDAVFPALDVLLVALVAQLAFTSRAARTPSLWLLWLAMVAFFAGDLLYALDVAGVVSGVAGACDLLFLLAYIGMGAATLHPTMRVLTEPPSGEVRPVGAARMAGIAAALLAPVVLATVFPPHGATDTGVRLALSAALTAAIVVRTVRAVNSHAGAVAAAREQATHDALTGLPNRVLLAEYVTETLSGPGGRVDVLFVDLDGFKLVNDSYGHGVGDELLVAVAGRLRALIRDEDLVCRVGGDEFVVVLTDPGDGLAELLSRRLVTDFAEPFGLSVGRVVVTPSIGIARSSAGVDAEELVRDADIAMYKAKSSGRNGFVVFDSSLREQVQARVELEQALRRAAEHDEFEVYYQPIIDLGTDELIGFEALLRWNHPERGLVGPDEFIPVAEETGLIVPIGSWVLRQATAQLAVWQDSVGSARELHMAVNVSTRQLQHSAFVDEVAVAVADAGLSPSALWLEITESAMMDDPESAAGTMRALRELGVKLAVDDFGTGYSALGYLTRFPVGVVKIDRSFVAGLGTDDDSEEIVRAVVAMAHAIGLSVVAEGIETPMQRDRLRELDCDMAQGYLYGRPRPASVSLSSHDRWLAGAL